MAARRMILALALPLLLSGCATYRQVHALDRVDFSIDDVAHVSLAGINLSGFSEVTDLGLADAAALANAVRTRNVPLSLEVIVLADNPEDNDDARLVRMDWTLFLQGRETLSGVIANDTMLPRGQPTSLAIQVNLNLADFFDGTARDLFELALSFTGMGGAPKNVTLTALPTVQTVFGPLTYTEPIRIVSANVGR
ncbi:MAG: hypothetical protein O2956_01850 [Gemmatimonadetes bacterium]|nr:hypothetical protein [Gemmatimonadota bacterium]